MSASSSSKSDKSAAKETTDVKAKFREVLDRKNKQASDGEAHEDRGSKVPQHAHGPVGGKREFRRKSG